MSFFVAGRRIYEEFGTIVFSLIIEVLFTKLFIVITIIVYKLKNELHKNSFLNFINIK